MNIQNKTIYHSDNIDILRAIDSDSVDLIYLDPPFNKRSTFVAKNRQKIEIIKQWFIDKQKNSFLPQYMQNQDIDEVFKDVKFSDEWKETDIKPLWRQQIGDEYPAAKYMIEASRYCAEAGSYYYLTFMAVRLIEIKRILKDTGSLYLHCDPTMSHYLKGIMDAIFGVHNFRNEIIWHYQTGGASYEHYSRKHEILFFYSKTDQYFIDLSRVEIPRTEKSLERAKNPKGARISRDNTTKIPNDVFTDIQALNPMARERTGYPTQKPLELLERIIQISTNERDVVLDPFCGCATTCIAADKLNRMWAGIDKSPQAAFMVYWRAYNEEVFRDKSHLDLFESCFSVRTECPIPSDKKLLERYQTITDLEKNYLKDNSVQQQTLLHLERVANATLTTKDREEIKAILYQDQAGLCNGCDQYKRLIEMELDHIDPRKKGGADTQTNLQLLCHLCNNLKRTGTMLDLIHKLAAHNLIPKEVFNKQKKRYSIGAYRLTTSNQ